MSLLGNIFLHPASSLIFLNGSNEPECNTGRRYMFDTIINLGAVSFHYNWRLFSFLIFKFLGCFFLPI